MDKKIEQKDALFTYVQDINKETWVINKKHIVSATSPLSATPITRIVLTTGAIINTYLSIVTIFEVISQIEHKSSAESEK
jgi:hypothetical protein